MTADVGERAADDDLVARFRENPDLFTTVHDRHFGAIYRYHPGTGVDRQLHAVNLLQTMLDAPVPSKVRAAAFRALAAMPNITNLGRTSGGYRLKIAYLNDAGGTDGTEKIIVDPKVARLRVEGWSGFGDGGLPVGPSTTTVLGWTDHLSGKLVPWKKQVPYLNPN